PVPAWQGRESSFHCRLLLHMGSLILFLPSFLLSLSAFLPQAAGERSKSVILVKNLPAGTRASELQEIFSRYGSLGRVLLPEGGITAIVEYLEPLEARRGFTSLAYSKFHDVPLYLEWAPMGVFSGHLPQTKEQDDKPGGEEAAQTEAGPDGETTENTQEKRAAAPEEEEDDEDEEDESLPGCTLFIKNLNFSTTEETLKEEEPGCELGWTGELMMELGHERLWGQTGEFPFVLQSWGAPEVWNTVMMRPDLLFPESPQQVVRRLD
ncbi:probable RNA-binding protein 19, partial [Vombatus ursinus]|uniref:probable RNA-binding protein 19 n=1 Tax=Vombatus ursinus TaxID=29139 RepID=UPI000FFD0CDC